MTQKALITGASSGIGKELAHIYAEHKGNLISSPVENTP